MSHVVMLVVGGVVVAVGLAVAAGRWRWRAGTSALRRRLASARESAAAAYPFPGDPDRPPPPVARYLHLAVPRDAPRVATVRIRHTGTFNTDPSGEQWRPFTSDQLVTTRPPGFDWDARIRMAPGVEVRVHDAYVAGEGMLHASLLGLVTLARPAQTAALAEGELFRFLAEAVWYPTVLLPGGGVTWAPRDDHSATATLIDGPHRVALTFFFGSDGLVERVRSEARGRMVGDVVVPTPWEGRFGGYAGRGGMCIPLEGEVAWMLEDGAHPYWRGRIIDIDHADDAGARVTASLRDPVRQGSL